MGAAIPARSQRRLTQHGAGEPSSRPKPSPGADRLAGQQTKTSLIAGWLRARGYPSRSLCRPETATQLAGLRARAIVSDRGVAAAAGSAAAIADSVRGSGNVG